jgi:exoribonuclease R
MFDFGIESEGFDQKIIQESKKLVAKAQDKFASELKWRLDLTNSIIMSVDSKKTKTIDDSFSIEKVTDKQIWRIGIHIADVASIINRKSKVYKEA